MASIRQIAQDVLYEARDGIAWIVLYKEGRSWGAECFWGEFDEQGNAFILDNPEDINRLREILEIDPDAIFVNPECNNLGPCGDEGMTRETLANGLRWQYGLQYSRLADTSIQSTAEPEADSPAAMSNDSSSAAKEKPVIPQQSRYCVPCPSGSVLSRNRTIFSVTSHEPVKIPTCDLHQRPPPNLWTSINPERSVSDETRQKAHAKAKRTASTGGPASG